MDGNCRPQVQYPGPFYSMSPPTMLPRDILTARLPQDYSTHYPTMSVDGLPNHVDEAKDHFRPVTATSSQQKSKRRSSQTADYVKHRRTRSGCYTCRQRRVKCDETRPMCKRCSKGKRECQYPDAMTTNPNSTRIGTKSQCSPTASRSSPSADECEADSIPNITTSDPFAESRSREDDHALGDHAYGVPDNSTRQDSIIQLVPAIKTSASTEPDNTRPRPTSTPDLNTKTESASIPVVRQRKMPNDIKFYLNFHRKHLSHHHYAHKCDTGDFLKTTFIDIALRHECGALLHGIVAFAAYHYAIQRGDGRLSPFLFHYNKSISLLQQSLQTRRHEMSTLLTILQLATIEEFLGDWVTLLGHQRAAHRILTDLFTPASIMQDETGRKILAWYTRLDIFAGMMSGGHAVLGREWAAAETSFYTEQVKNRPDDLDARFEENFATSRLLAADMGTLFAALQHGTISAQQFETDVEHLAARFTELSTRLETAFTESDCFVKDFENTHQPSQDDLSDFCDPNFLYRDNLFTMNFILADFWAIDLMFRRQLAEARGQIPGSEVAGLASKKCKMFEAVQYCKQGPPGAILGFQASLGILSLCVPNDTRHTNWCRRKYALMEQHGYNYPSMLRQRMSDVWSENVTRWWLPDDEGFKPIIAALREFVTFRSSLPRDAWATKLRDMKGIFRNLSVQDDWHNPEPMAFCALDSDPAEFMEDAGGSWADSPENWLARVDETL